MGSVRIAERFTPIRAEGVVVDRDAGVIRNVLVCGFNSANGRRYPADVLRAAVGLYEGRPVNLDHADRPTMGRRIGWLSNVRAGADGRPRADLNILRTHKEADAVFEAAERRPELCGLSHVALCRTRRDRDGVEVIEAIESVESVDLVADPATTPGLKHESKGTAVNVTLNKLVEWLAPKVPFDQLARVKRLSEMDGMGDLEVPEPAAETSPDDAIDGAFKQAMHAVIDGYPDQLDGPGVLAKLKELLKAHGKLGDSGGGDDKPAEDGSEGGEDKSKESKTVTQPDAAAAIREAIDVCRKVGFKGFDADDLDLIASAPAERREAVARRLMGTVQQPAGAEKPKSAGRAGAAKLDESADDRRAAPPTDGKKFAEHLTR
jgi:hypothetical protein